MSTTRLIRRLAGALGLVPALLAVVAGAPGAAPAAPGDAAGAREARRAFTLEDLYRLARPAGVDVSPDGRRLVYALTTRDLPRGRSNTDLYLLPAKGGEPRRLTWTDERAEASPRWSPRGDAIAFVAPEDDVDQLWLLPMAGGEARRLTKLATGVAGPVWSPDGRTIAFESRVYPECGADDACNRRRIEARRDGMLKVHLADELLYRHWTSWADGRVTHVLVVDVETGAVRDMTPGDRDAPVFSLGGGDIAFSSDGSELLYTRNPDPLDRLALSTNSDVFAVPLVPDEADPERGAGAVAPAAAVDLTRDNPAWDGRPRVSPADARQVAFLRQHVPGYESDLVRLAVLDRKTGAVRELATALDDPVSDFAWLPDGNGLLAIVPRRGTTPLLRVDLATGAVRDVADFGDIEELAVSPRGDAAYVVRSRVGEPHEIWRVPLRGQGGPERLTFHNRTVEREVDIRPAEALWVEGPGGRKIHVFVVKPHGFEPGRKYPLILNVHGGPQMMWSDRFRGDWQVYPGAGYVVAFPNPTGSTGYGHEFTRAISRDWGGRVFEELDAVAEALAALPYVDADRMGAMGWSWGGYAMAWMLGHTERFRAMASMMGLYDLRSFWGATEELWFPEWDLGGVPWESPDYERFSPAGFAKNFRTPTLVICGERDYRVPYTQGLQLFTALRRQKVPARLIVLTESGHWPGWYDIALYYTAHLEWFSRWLGGGGPPWSTADFAANLVFDRETGERIDGPPRDAGRVSR